MFLTHHRVPANNLKDPDTTSYHPPTQTEAAQWFKDNLLHIKGYKPEEVAIGDWAEDLPLPLAHKETYRELPVPGEDSFCLEYAWKCEGSTGTFAEESGLGDTE